jgi:hypothetical protein
LLLSHIIITATKAAGCSTSGCKVFSASCRLVLFKLTGLDFGRKCSSALHVVKSYERPRERERESTISRTYNARLAVCSGIEKF